MGAGKQGGRGGREAREGDRRRQKEREGEREVGSREPPKCVCCGHTILYGVVLVAVAELCWKRGGGVRV